MAKGLDVMALQKTFMLLSWDVSGCKKMFVDVSCLEVPSNGSKDLKCGLLGS